MVGLQHVHSSMLHRSIDANTQRDSDSFSAQRIASVQCCDVLFLLNWATFLRTVRANASIDVDGAEDSPTRPPVTAHICVIFSLPNARSRLLNPVVIKRIELLDVCKRTVASKVFLCSDDG